MWVLFPICKSITRSQHKVDISCESKTYDNMIMAYIIIHFFNVVHQSFFFLSFTICILQDIKMPRPIIW